MILGDYYYYYLSKYNDISIIKYYDIVIKTENELCKNALIRLQSIYDGKFCSKEYVKYSEILINKYNLQCSDTYLNLTIYYNSIGDYTKFKQYMILLIKNNNIDDIDELFDIYNEKIDSYYEGVRYEMISFITPLFKLQNFLYKFIFEIYKSKIDLIDLHFNYQPNGDGCKEAKNDFIKKLIN